MTSNHGTLREGSVAEWSACRTRNPAVPGSSPALATCLILQHFLHSYGEDWQTGAYATELTGRW